MCMCVCLCCILIKRLKMAMSIITYIKIFLRVHSYNNNKNCKYKKFIDVYVSETIHFILSMNNKLFNSDCEIDKRKHVWNLWSVPSNAQLEFAHKRQFFVHTTTDGYLRTVKVYLMVFNILFYWDAIYQDSCLVQGWL